MLSRIGSLFTLDGQLQAWGVAEEDRETIKTLFNTLGAVATTHIPEIYRQYRALPDEQRARIRQNLLQGAREFATGAREAFTGANIRELLQVLGTPQNNTARVMEAPRPLLTERADVRVEELDDDAELQEAIRLSIIEAENRAKKEREAAEKPRTATPSFNKARKTKRTEKEAESSASELEEEKKDQRTSKKKREEKEHKSPYQGRKPKKQ